MTACAPNNTELSALHQAVAQQHFPLECYHTDRAPQQGRCIGVRQSSTTDAIFIPGRPNRLTGGTIFVDREVKGSLTTGFTR